MAARPPPPTLSLRKSDTEAQIEFDVPATWGRAYCAIHLITPSGDKHFYDANKGGLRPVGESGKAIPLQQRRHMSLTLTGLEKGVAYAATVCFRAADDAGMGPESPPSDPLTRARPVACGAPTLEAVSDTKIRVRFAVPPDCKYASVRFYEDGAKHGRKVAQDTFTLRKVGESGPSLAVETSRSIVVKGLSPTVTYTAAVIAGNYVGFGPSSPASRPLKLADYSPPAPCVPALSKITSDAVRVRFSLSPDCDLAVVYFKNGRSLQMESTYGDQGFVVPGLLPDTEYEVCVSAHSKFGWSPDSPFVKFRTLKDGDVEITGTKTQAERDAEAKKRAVDVDAEDDGEPERVEKRAKPER
jgi:hypothetical protein